MLNFTKMHGLGNDFILIDARSEELKSLDLGNLATILCDRHFGVGADGLIIVWPSDKAHYRMQIINSDGSEPEMCGNGIRCFARYVYEKDQLQEEVISVETLAGIKLPAIILDQDKKVVGIEVDMGSPQIGNKQTLEVRGLKFDVNEVSMGNPHAVIFVDDLTKVDLVAIGPEIENHPNYLNRTNVEFVKVLNDKEIEVMVWERGVGETMACGTGACAAMVASQQAGKINKRALVHLPGGNLDIELNEDNHVLMRGPAKSIYEGKYYL